MKLQASSEYRKRQGEALSPMPSASQTPKQAILKRLWIVIFVQCLQLGYFVYKEVMIWISANS